MNIPITKEQAKRLDLAVTKKYVYGSRLFGVNRPDSDTDIIALYEYDDVFDVDTHLPNLHSFKYEDVEQNTDTIYMTYDQFWLSFYNGDGTMYADVILFSDGIDVFDMCRTYKIIKGYCGTAKRDLTSWDKSEKMIRKSARNLYIAKCLICKVSPSIKDIQNIHNQYLPNELESYRIDLLTAQYDLRKQANDMFNNHELVNYYIEPTNDELLNIMLTGNNLTEYIFKNDTNK